MTPAEPRAATIIERGALAICAFATLAVLGWMLWLGPHGLDFSDEGFYLAWLADPFLYDASASQFGFVYRPLFLALRGDVGALRQANVLLCWGACFAMFLALARRTQPTGAARLPRGIAAAGLAVAALAVFSGWLVTPNYNTLVLQSFAVVVCGLAMANGARAWRGAVLVGLGGALAFLAKPSSAAALAPLAGIVLLAEGRSAWRTLPLAAFVAVVALLGFALAVDGSPQEFLERLSRGAEVMRLLGSTYSWQESLRWESFTLTAREREVVMAAALACGGGAWTALRREALPRIAGAMVAMAGASLALAWLARGEPPLPPSLFENLVLSGAALGAAGAAACARRPRLDHARTWLQGACIAALPAAHAFGSNNYYWHVGGYAGVVWIAGGAFVLAAAAAGPREAARAWLPVAGAALCLSTLLLLIGQAQPYRQTAAVSAQRTPMQLRGARVYVTPEVATHFAELQSGARAAGLRPGTAVLDFTGQSPAALYALRARAVGLPRLAGGYPGSNALAAWVLRRLPCGTIAGAWLMVEPGGPRALDLGLLEGEGARVARDYEPAFGVTTPPGAGEAPHPRAQSLLRPLRTPAAARAACEAARGAAAG
jgi:hypothetical protein